MRKLFAILLIILLVLVGVAGCSDDEAVDLTTINKQTVFIYMPWSGSQTDAGLLRYLKNNLDSIESAIVENKGLKNSRVLVFLSTTATESELYEMVYDGATRSIIHMPVNTYSNYDCTKAENITALLNEVRSKAEALNYAMIIGGHGCGWTYKEDWQRYPYRSKGQNGKDYRKSADAWPFVKNDDIPQTRFFGSVTSMDYSSDLPELAKGIEDSGIKLQYILFDDCYMANAETAYELRNAANFLIASASEVMAIGMPYKQMWKSLNAEAPQYATAVTSFYDFYSKYAAPYGNISVIDCRQMESLAAVMKEINDTYTFDEEKRADMQVLCGFEPTLFYDMQSYVDRLGVETALYNRFKKQLQATVKASKSTEKVYSALYAKGKEITVTSFSGLTISDPSTNPVAIKGKEKTGWWQATHSPLHTPDL